MLGRAGQPLRAVVDVPHPRDRARRDDPTTVVVRRTITDALEDR